MDETARHRALRLGSPHEAQTVESCAQLGSWLSCDDTAAWVPDAAFTQEVIARIWLRHADWSNSCRVQVLRSFRQRNMVLNSSAQPKASASLRKVSVAATQAFTERALLPSQSIMPKGIGPIMHTW